MTARPGFGGGTSTRYYARNEEKSTDPPVLSDHIISYRIVPVTGEDTNPRYPIPRPAIITPKIINNCGTTRSHSTRRDTYLNRGDVLIQERGNPLPPSQPAIGNTR